MEKETTIATMVPPSLFGCNLSYVEGTGLQKDPEREYKYSNDI